MLTPVLLASSVVLLCGLAVVGCRNRSEPGADVFALLEAVSAAWAALTLVGLRLPPGPARLRVWGATTAISLLVVLLWMAFILRYTGRERWLRPSRFGAAAAPLLSGVLAFALAPRSRLLVGRLEQSVTGIGTVVNVSGGPLGVGFGLYIYLLFAAGIVIVVKTLLEGPTRFVGQALALLLGTLVTVAASLGELAGVPWSGYPLTQATLGVQALLWGYAVFGERLLRSTPGVAMVGERAVFDELDDGILVIDGAGTVARANPKARAHIGGDPAGTPVERILDRHDIGSLDDLHARFQRRGRTYQVKSSAVTDWRGTTVGHVLAIRDVTDLTRRQQRLEVLTRILRHNLRNDMMLVRGFATEIREQSTGDQAARAEKIVGAAEGLLAISEKAVEMDRLLEQDGPTTSVDVATLLKRHVDGLTDRYPEASVELTVDASEIRTAAGLLSLVLEETIENALKHGGEAGTVGIEATMDGDRLRVVVTDDGPGIPSVELTPIRSGTETKLEHATGLGLWLIHWGTQSLGGDVAFEASDAGTRATLTVPHGRLDRREPLDTSVEDRVATTAAITRTR
jgi:signal transduction histidine kinase